MKINTILKYLKTDFKTLCKKINKYGNLSFHIRNGQEVSFAGKNGQKRKSIFLLMLADANFKLPPKIIDYLISLNVHLQTYDYLSCDYHIKVALANRHDLKERHIEILSNSHYSNGAYVLRNIAKNNSISETILRNNIFKWFDTDGAGAYHNSAASLAIGKINFTENEIRCIYKNYKKLTKRPIESVILLLIQSPKTPTVLFEEFCKNDDFHIKVALANDNRTPISVLNEFSKNDDSWIKNGAIKTLADINYC